MKVITECTCIKIIFHYIDINGFWDKEINYEICVLKNNRKFIVITQVSRNDYIKHISEKFYHSSKYNRHRSFGPVSVYKIRNGTNPEIISFTFMFYNKCLSYFMKNEINEWLNEKNIVLSKENNYEIPDEHKAEFKLRFHR